MNEPDNAVPKEELVFDDEGIHALREFGKVLQRIHDRLVSEGVEIEVDDQYKPKDQD